eukprot:COSAG02_NODE_969_length_15565_cov_9.614833_4_plen_52_part_00
MRTHVYSLGHLRTDPIAMSSVPKTHISMHIDLLLLCDSLDARLVDLAKLTD